MMRRLSLRARLTMLVAITVAVALAGCAIGAWFLTRSQLYSQLDATLTNAAPGPGGGGPDNGDRPRDKGNGGGAFHGNDPIASAFKTCRAKPASGSSSTSNSDTNSVRYGERATQTVLPNGHACTVFPTAGIVVTSDDIAVASGKVYHIYRDGVTTTGVEMRVYTRYLPDQGGAITIAERLGPTLSSLNTLTLWLGGVSILGIAIAASVGMLVARASLRPVDKLTATVEHIAQTEDLDAQIPVEGNDEIARLGDSFNTMTTALASARDHQRRLIADAGHELRTPLTSLRTNIDLLLRSESTGRPLPPETRNRMLVNVKAQLQELSSLVVDLLELARPDQTQPSVEVVPMHDVVVHAVERAKLRGPGLRIEGEIAKWYVHGDPRSLQRAVVNLLDNAVKYSPPGGTIEVRLTDHGVLTVRDHGPGIAPEDLPHVFERFWRSPSSRSMPGSGLGLSIVARVVQEAGGDVRLDRAPGGDTVATVKLPGSIDH